MLLALREISLVPRQSNKHIITTKQDNCPDIFKPKCSRSTKERNTNSAWRKRGITEDFTKEKTFKQNLQEVALKDKKKKACLKDWKYKRICNKFS